MTPSSYETSRGRIRYRIVPSRQPPGEDGVQIWFMEYAQDWRRPDDWSPRGTVREVDGKFEWLGELYDSPYAVLEARLRQGP